MATCRGGSIMKATVKQTGNLVGWSLDTEYPDTDNPGKVLSTSDQGKLPTPRPDCDCYWISHAIGGAHEGTAEPTHKTWMFSLDYQGLEAGDVLDYELTCDRYGVSTPQSKVFQDRRPDWAMPIFVASELVWARVTV